MDTEKTDNTQEVAVTVKSLNFAALKVVAVVEGRRNQKAEVGEEVDKSTADEEVAV